MTRERGDGSRWARLDLLLAAIAIIFGLAYLFQLMVGGRGLDFAYVSKNYGQYLRAASFNVYITTISFTLGIVIGFFMGWLRTIRTVPLKKVLYDFRLLADASKKSKIALQASLALTVLWAGLKYAVRRIGNGYVEIVRGTPLFVQILFIFSIFLVFYGTTMNPNVLAFTAGVIALTVNTGGYQSEIFRGGLQTVHAGQVEAARAVGFSRLGAMRHVVLPQALRLIIPPLTNEYIGLFKASTLLFFLGIQGEITFLAWSEAFRGNVFEIFAIVTAIFLSITVSVAKGVQYLEKRFRIPGLGIQAAPTDRARIFGGLRPVPREV